MARNESARERGMDLYEKPLTRGDVETIVERALGPNYKIHNYRLKNFSNESLGYMGAHRNVVVEVSRDDSSLIEQHTYFVKSVPYNISEQAKILEDSKMFRKEASFYDLIVPELSKSSKDNSWVARCYLVKEDALVFENLIVKDYKIGEKFLNVASLKAALSSLAKMHAASLLAEARLGKTFIEMYPQLLDEVLYVKHGPFANWYKSGVNGIVCIAKYLGWDDEIVPKVCELMFEKIRPSKTRSNVINHGDAWSNNLMFNGSNCVMVDFQLIRYLPPMADVTLLIYHNCDKQLRDEHQTDLLKHYHRVLCETLKDGGQKDLPRFEDVLDEYEEMKIVGIVTTNIYYQINKMSGEKQLEFMSTSEKFNNALFGNRVPLITESLETDVEYKKFVSSALRELLDIAPKYLG